MSEEQKSLKENLWDRAEEILDDEISDPASIIEMLETTEKGQIKQTLENIMYVFRHDNYLRGAIQKNEMTDRIDITKKLNWKRSGETLTDNDEYQIYWYFEKTYLISNERKIRQGIRMIAEENRYHPIRDCLESLKWDGEKRVDKLLPKFFGVDDNFYSKEVIRVLMKAMIHRIYNPGCKFEIMVCLVGGQGVGKSTFFRFLTMNDDWFSDDLKRLDDDKVYRKLQGHWLIEMSEMLATANARSIEDIKSFLSRQKDNYKIPYETHPEDRPRQCVFVGTSNNMDFLPLDRTGNRRFAPVPVHPEKVDKHILENAKESREFIRQAWAEAYMEYKSDSEHKLDFSRETKEYLKKLQVEFMPEDTKVGIIQSFLDETDEDYVCSRMIYKEAFNHEYDEPKQWELNEINDIMNDCIDGFEKVSSHRFKEHGIQRAWKRTKPRDFESVDDNENPFVK